MLSLSGVPQLHNLKSRCLSIKEGSQSNGVDSDGLARVSHAILVPVTLVVIGHQGALPGKPWSQGMVCHHTKVNTDT